MKKLKKGEHATLDDIILAENRSQLTEYLAIEGEEDGIAYEESDDEESVEEVGTDGELRRKPSHYRRFNAQFLVPIFEIGMKFSDKKEFKEAIIKYCLAKRKVIRFIKDEPTRVRAKCDWQHCPWVCLCSKN